MTTRTMITSATGLFLGFMFLTPIVRPSRGLCREMFCFLRLPSVFLFFFKVPRAGGRKMCARWVSYNKIPCSWKSVYFPVHSYKRYATVTFYGMLKLVLKGHSRVKHIEHVTEYVPFGCPPEGSIISQLYASCPRSRKAVQTRCDSSQATSTFMRHPPAGRTSGTARIHRRCH